MFLHLGNDISIRLKDVISIYDYELFQKGSNRAFLDMARENIIHAVGEGQEKKSLVVTKDRIYLSAISPLTLSRRTRKLWLDE